MSVVPATPTTADRAADVIRGKDLPAWEVFGQRLVHHEIHLNGRRIELLRGPIELEGFSVRVFDPRDGAMGVGFASSNDPSPEGVRRAFDSARRTAPHSTFPARSVELPGSNGAASSLQTVDPTIRDAPAASIQEFVRHLLDQFPQRSDVQPSFGSVRVTYGERSVANSSGLHRSGVSSYVEFEWAVKASGGPEGRPPGEYWVNSDARRLDGGDLGIQVERWAELARDVRIAKAPPSGSLDVVFPPEALHDIIPPILGFRLSGSARLRKMAPEVGSPIAAPLVSISDEPHAPWGVGSMEFDDEGLSTRARPVIQGGSVSSIFYDLLHAASFGEPPTGSGHRSIGYLSTWFRFPSSVMPGPSNLTVAAGKDGSDEELIGSVRDGLWLQQLGYAFPDPVSGAYGGEIRIGYRIRNGKLAEPVRGGTIGGLLMGPQGAGSLLRDVRAVGTVSRQVGHLTTPPLLVGATPVAGPD
ncbi:MAG TPA: TldD/PmbA family protein [Thermoplasmata archaeon]|nr:TldD/PmbA family protein [Thermoplasmata archaeon]